MANLILLLCLGAAYLYLAICASLRYRRRDALKKDFPHHESLSRMTNVEAQQIVNRLVELEFPLIVLTSLQFGLFKTYGIPTISQLLLETRQFSDPKYANKRYTDTTILIQEFSDHHPTSERTIKAIARMNYIHSRYQKAGKISNDDLLYTLSVFILEPIAWVEKYEWREMSDIEKNALATFWKSIGDSMEISYQPLTQNPTWPNGLAFYTSIKTWAESYEATHMLPSPSNRAIADGLIPLLIFYIPNPMRPFATNIITSIMGTRLREAMLFPPPPGFYLHLANAIFTVRKLFLRYLSLPRPNFLRVQDSTDTPDAKTGNFYKNSYMANPYYIKPTLWNRWGLKAWFVWLAGGDVPGSKGGVYSSDGYKIEEVGPMSMRKQGKVEMEEWKAKIGEERPLGCPFAFGG